MITALTKKCSARLLPQGKFARAVATLASGTVLSQAIVIIASPLVTRLYSPADFGVLAVYAALLGILAVVANMRYHLAIPLPKTGGSAANVLALAILWVAGITLLSLLAVAGFRQQIADHLETPQLGTLLWLLPVGVAMLGTYQAFSYWAVREKAFGCLTRTKIQQSLALVATQTSVGALGTGTSIGLILGQIVGQSAGLSTLISRAIRTHGEAFRRIRWSRIRWAGRRYRRFPIFSSWGAIMNTAGTQLPPLIFASFFGPAVVGLYYFVSRILQMPLQFLGDAIGKTLHISAIEAMRDGKLPRLVLGVFSGLATVGIVPIVLFGFVAPESFEMIFGHEWREAGIYAQWMIPLLIGSYLRSPLSSLTLALELQVQGLCFQLVLFVLRLSGLLVGVWQNDPLIAVAGFSLGSLLAYLVFLGILLRSAGVQLFQWLPQVIRYILLGGLLGYLVSWTAGRLIPLVHHGYSQVILTALVAVLWFLWRADLLRRESAT